MNPPCPYCKKTVYPTEKLNCLDKIWHKGCFKCTTCGLKLTMNTYKGYDKMPYCNTHYPHLKATAVRQTVEGARLSNISKQQSQVEYHKQFNMSKGSKVSVADDPETMRQVKVSQQQSNVVYSSHAQKKAAAEQKRPSQDDQPEPAPSLQHPSPLRPTEYDPVKELESDGIPESLFVTKYSIQDASQELSIQGQAPRKIGSIHDFNIDDESHGFSHHAQPSGQGNYRPPPPEPVAPPPPKGPLFRAMYDYAAADTDEVSFVEGDIIINTEAIDEGWMTGTVERTGETDRGAYQQPQAPYQPPPQQQAPYQPPPQPQQDYNQPPPTSYGGGGYAPEPEPEPAPQADYHDPQPQSDLIQFTALYDYDAADADEVSFKEGDLFQGTIIDEGWIEGTVMSGAGGFGMAPRNYFEQM